MIADRGRLDHDPADRRRLRARSRADHRAHAQFRRPARISDAARSLLTRRDRARTARCCSNRSSPTSASSSPIRALYWQVTGKGLDAVPLAARCGTRSASLKTDTAHTDTNIHFYDSSEFSGRAAPRRSSATCCCPDRRCAGASRSREARDRARRPDPRAAHARWSAASSLLGIGLIVMAALQTWYGLRPLRRVRSRDRAIAQRAGAADRWARCPPKSRRWSRNSTRCSSITTARPRKRGATPATSPMRSRRR